MTKRVVFHIDANSAFLSLDSGAQGPDFGGEGGLAGDSLGGGWEPNFPA